MFETKSKPEFEQRAFIDTIEMLTKFYPTGFIEAKLVKRFKLCLRHTIMQSIK